MILTGYRYSVYTRAVRMALLARGLAHQYREVDPFDPVQARSLRALHPFGRVPVLEHGDFRLWETQAILDYVAQQGGGAPLLPGSARAQARIRQVMGIADSYVYGALVRQAVSHAIFLPQGDTDSDRALTIIAAGLKDAPLIMDTLDELAREGLVLVPGALSLADCHLWPMLDYVRMIPEGCEIMEARVALARWADAMAAHPVARETRPDLSRLAEQPR